MDQQKKEKFEKGTLITYRQDIKVLDATIRDGGLINGHNFEDEFVKAVYNACLAAGVDYIELGYKASKKIFAPSQHGPWKYCDEDYIRKVIGEKKNSMKLCAMADAERTDYHTDILPKKDSILDCIRVATYIHQIPTALAMINDAHDKGYEVTVNLMAVSVVTHKDLFEAIELFAKSPVATIYLVDSFGAYYPEQVRELTSEFKRIASGTRKLIGIHTHNNQQLAYANTIEALVSGASMLDATINGMGRGAGNCALEMLLGFLKNPKYDIRPVLECIEKHFIPIKNKMDWGYSIPYMITGQMNQHPRSAIKVMESEARDKLLAFYDQMNEEES
ncbi:MAG: aldolase catalytic domain-containing protein [Endomicrobiales bacterium]|nr:aldolase catalytic domain-containing protein [Endomicrobiales bacterium]